MKSKNNILQETDTLQDATLTSKVKKQDVVSTWWAPPVISNDTYQN